MMVFYDEQCTSGIVNRLQVAKLQRASLRNPVKVEVSTKYQTVDKLLQYYIFIPAKFKVNSCESRSKYLEIF